MAYVLSTKPVSSSFSCLKMFVITLHYLFPMNDVRSLKIQGQLYYKKLFLIQDENRYIKRHGTHIEQLIQAKKCVSCLPHNTY